jgi:hypothetical protein
MKLRLLLPVFVTTLALVSATSAWSAEYQLKKSGLKVGDTLNEESKMDGEADLVLKFQGQEIKGKMTMEKRGLKITKVTTVDGSGVSGVDTEIKQATEKQSMTINDKEQKTEKNDPLHETSVSATKVDGKWTNQLKGGAPTAEQEKELPKMRYFQSDEFFEDRPVAVGQSWAVPPDRLAKTYSTSLAGNVVGTMQCKFERVEEFNGRSCAVIAVALKITGNLPNQPEASMTMDLKGTIHRVLELNYDAKVTLNGTMTVDGPIPKGPPGSKMEASGPLTMSETMTLVK